MRIIIEVKLAEGYYSSDLKTLDIIDSETKEVIANFVPREYAKLIIKAVNEYKEEP